MIEVLRMFERSSWALWPFEVPSVMTDAKGDHFGQCWPAERSFFAEQLERCSIGSRTRFVRRVR